MTTIWLTTRRQTWHPSGMQLSSIRTSGQDRDRYAHRQSRDGLVGTRTREQSRRREAGQRHVRRGIGSEGLGHVEAKEGAQLHHVQDGTAVTGLAL
jgi:hypothetical protein